MSALIFVAVLLGAALALSAIMAGAWRVQQRTRNAGWIDTIWTFGLGAVGVVCALLPLSPGWPAPRQIAVALLVAVWSGRLGWHIASRTMQKTDDPRYAELQREWGADAPRQMFWLLQKQAWVSIPMALSILLAGQNPLPGLRLVDMLGFAIITIALAGEAVADRQLRTFAADPAHKGRVCDVGLWAWSRHPNYFFQWLGWLGYPLLAMDFAHPLGFLAWGGPICMYWLLVHVSGIPPLEDHMLKTRGEAFRAYRRRTSAFFPLPPRAVA